jgi:undecaprenyl diphosphate synthase
VDQRDDEIQASLKASGNVPRHIAIIMDGNGRWAVKRGLPRREGHRAARDVVRDVVRGCGELGVEVLTLFAFGTENWRRPWAEVLSLMKLLRDASRQELPELQENRVRLVASGNTDRLPLHSARALNQAISETAANTGLTLNLALSYDGRSEILDAVRRIAVEVENGSLRSDEIDDARFAQSLYTAGLPDPDLLIRTSGELRLSNFMLWQCAYTELWFTPVLWPDFRREHLYEAIRSFQARERRFGQTSAQVREGEESGNGALREAGVSTA